MYCQKLFSASKTANMTFLCVVFTVAVVVVAAAAAAAAAVVVQ